MSKPTQPQIRYNLPVMLMHQGNYFVAYTPALEFSVQGKTKEQVQERFSEAVTLFFEELHRLGTTDEVLEELGWQKMPKSAWQPPRLVDNAPTSYEVPIPAFA